ncbi:glycosyltransferase [Streptococcus suis]
MKIVIVNCFDTYEHRVDLLLAYFLSRGDEVSVIASNFRHIDKVKRFDKKKHYTFVDAIPYRKNLSYTRLKSHWKIAKQIFSELPCDIDLLWVLVPPNSFVKQAAEYKKRNPCTKLVFDIIDMWPETIPANKFKNFFLLKLWGNIRDSYLKYSDYVVTECGLYQTKLPLENFGNRISTLYLSFGDVNIARDNSLLNLSGKEIVLCYLGSMNNIVDINIISNIIASLSMKYAVTLHLVGDGEKKENLLLLLKSQKIKIIDHGKIFDQEVKSQILSKCHFGLNIMKKEVFVGLTMKSLDYLKNGLPLINNLKGDTWGFVERDGIGINTEDGVITAEVLTDYFEKYYHIQSFYSNHFSEQKFYSDLSLIMKKIECD